MMENTVYKMNKVEGPLIWTSLVEWNTMHYSLHAMCDDVLDEGIEK